MSDLLQVHSIAVFAVAAVVAGWMTRWLATTAAQRGMIDRPNDRSSHSIPTPRGGGLAMVFATAALAVSLAVGGVLPAWEAVALIPPFLALAAVGWIDDRGGVSPRVRLLVHLSASAWFLAWCFARASWAAGLALATPGGVLASVILTLALGWAINLYNFMDGIDGLAGAQGLFLGLGGALLLVVQGGDAEALVMLAVAGACAGFLVWNWAPARIFMGDVGSGALGFLLAAVPLTAVDDVRTDVWPWLILWGSFVADASVTLVRRALRGVALHEAHRTHAYQRLARRWHSHRAVSLSYSAVNLVWLGPIAVLAAARPATGPIAALVALCPLVLGMSLLGAGRAEFRETEAS